MHESLKNITAITLVLTGLIISFTQLQNFIDNSTNEKAKTEIIKVMAQECKEIKEHYKIGDTFEETTKVVDKMFGNGVRAISENTYLSIVSFCYGVKKQVPKEKI